MKYIITVVMLLAFPVTIALNDAGWFKLAPKDWGIFITSYIFILLGISALVAISDGSTDKL